MTEPISEGYDDLIRQVEERPNNPAYMECVRRIMERERDVLERLAVADRQLADTKSPFSCSYPQNPCK